MKTIYQITDEKKTLEANVHLLKDLLASYKYLSSTQDIRDEINRLEAMLKVSQAKLNTLNWVLDKL